MQQGENTHAFIKLLGWKIWLPCMMHEEEEARKKKKYGRNNPPLQKSTDNLDGQIIRCL